MPEVQIEPGKRWTATDEYQDHISREDQLATGQYLRRRGLLGTESPQHLWGRRKRHHTRVLRYFTDVPSRWQHSRRTLTEAVRKVKR